MPSVKTSPTKEARPLAAAPPQRIWNLQRQLAGNLIPIVLSLPTAIYGLMYMVSHSEVMGKGFWIFESSPLIGWLAVNYLGLWGNSQLRHIMHERLLGMRPKITDKRYFVGMATPKHSAWLDPHEDVGFLILHPTKLEFYGDHIKTTMDKRDVTAIGFRANAHTLVGLGRWVSIEGRIGELHIRMKVELREKSTLLGNMLLSKGLKRKLQAWLKETEPQG